MAICAGIWAVISLFAGEVTYFWPGWAEPDVRRQTQPDSAGWVAKPS